MSFARLEFAGSQRDESVVKVVKEEDVTKRVYRAFIIQSPDLPGRFAHVKETKKAASLSHSHCQVDCGHIR